MKKMILLFLIVIFCFGCHQETGGNQQFDDYKKLKEQLLVHHEMDNDFPFSVSLVFNELNEKYRYDVIIDQPKASIYNIIAIAYADETAEQICPTIGVFDDIKYHLKPNFIDKENGFYKGVQLSGTCLQKKSVKVYISYVNDLNKQERIEKYIEVNTK